MFDKITPSCNQLGLLVVMEETNRTVKYSEDTKMILSKNIQWHLWISGKYQIPN